MTPVSIIVSMICLISLLFAAPARAHAVEYTLQVASLIDDAFVYFIKGSIGCGEGEPPPEPATFRTAIGWARRGSNDRIRAGTGGTGGMRR